MRGVVIAFLALACTASVAAQTSEWMRRSDYQEQLKEKTQEGLYPAGFAAACQHGHGHQDRVQVTWKRLPQGASFVTHIRMSRQRYERRNAELRAKGYERASMHEYTDCKGDRWIQALWMQDAAAKLARPKASVLDEHWMSAAQFRQESERRRVDNLYPGEVRGECQGGAERFRAAWTSNPPGASVQSYVGMTESLFNGRDASFRSNGYARVWVGDYRDCAGGKRFDATWIKLPAR